MLESNYNFDLMTGNLPGVALLFKILENSRKLPYFEKNQLCACLIYACT